jgi:hypothetical protein
MPTFDSPSHDRHRLEEFGLREVGINHPDVPGFFRIRDNGDVEIVAGEGLAIVMSPRSGSITLVADHIKFMTRHDGGLRWNKVNFNERAVSFHEPTFISVEEDRETTIYNGVDDYVLDVDDPAEIVVKDSRGSSVPLSDYIDGVEKDV